MSRIECPDCGSGRGLAVYTKNTYCFVCHKKTMFRSLLNKDIEKKYSITIDDAEKLPYHCRNLLGNYYINEQHEECYGISYSRKLARILFYVGGTLWARSLEIKAVNKWLKLAGNDKYFVLYNTNLHDTLCIVEDPISAIRCADTISTLCLCGTNFSNDEFKEKIQPYKNLLVFLDADDPGKDATARLVKDYKLLKNVVVVRNKKDPKCYGLFALFNLITMSVCSADLSGADLSGDLRNE